MVPIDRSILLPLWNPPKPRRATKWHSTGPVLLRQGGTLGLQSTPGCHKGAFEVPLGEEGLREIDITLIIKATIFWSGLFGQPP